MIEFVSDKWKISGPRIDGTFVVSFELGEYQKEKIAELVAKFNPTDVLTITATRAE